MGGWIGPFAFDPAVRARLAAIVGGDEAVAAVERRCAFLWAAMHGPREPEPTNSELEREASRLDRAAAQPDALAPSLLRARAAELRAAIDPANARRGKTTPTAFVIEQLAEVLEPRGVALSRAPASPFLAAAEVVFGALGAAVAPDEAIRTVKRERPRR
jgi:hypothetical protein